MRNELRPRDARDRMIVALDVTSVGEARRLIGALGDSASFFKLGMQIVFAGGLALVGELLGTGKRVFLDMKLLDIDNTVEGAIRSIAALGVTFTTVHAYPNAMRAAARARPAGGPGLLAVTVLTSMDDADLRAAGYAGDSVSLVSSRAADGKVAGMDGIVCSPREAAEVRRLVGPEMLIVTPGVRPPGHAERDQKRTMNPAEAIGAGADYLVVGRPVTGAADPATAASSIVKDIERALPGG